MARESSIPDYETVAKSQTGQVLGGTGAQGDYLERIIIIPETTAAGAVALLDGSTSTTLHVGGGTTALVSLEPLTVHLGAYSKNGAWSVTTGDNVHVIAVGQFTRV